MSEFTPGPWSWVIQDVSMASLMGPDRLDEQEEGDHVLSLGPCANCVKHAGGPTGQWKWGRCRVPSEEDARLIAAAPDLYAALAEAVRFLDYFANGRTGFVGGGTPLSCLEQARAALAAADGRDVGAKP